MKRSLTLSLATLLVALSFTANLTAQDTNPLFTQEKVKNYMPHMSWLEVEEALTRTDVALIPVGSIEQHGKHLPLGTDFLAAQEACKLIAQQTDVLVVPVVIETVQALIHHGIRKIAFYNGHGGNSTSVANVINRINNSTVAAAVDLGEIELPSRQSPYPAPALDYHAGVGETSWMRYLTPALVDMSRAENPRLTPPPQAQAAMETMTGANASVAATLYLFRPEETGKNAASHQISSNGVFTTGDITTATAAEGKFRFDQVVEGAVRFIEEWKRIG